MENVKKTQVCIIDYGLGNLTSVKNAFELIGVQTQISNDSGVIERSSHLVLPGVGSFGAGMENLHKLGLVDILRESVLSKKKKLIGICLGMQLLATVGYEHGEHEGLNLIKGKVEQINVKNSKLSLPHIGWNDVDIERESCIAQQLSSEPLFYFLHSYHLVPETGEQVIATCKYGHNIVAMIQNKNVFGTQFHPEKSHIDGIQILKNFVAC